MLRPWKFALADAIDASSGRPVYLQLVHALVQDIRRGRLPPGAVLPSSRELAETLGVNRKTVVLAYDDLVAQGWLTAQGTRGTFVSKRLPEPPVKAEAAADETLLTCAADYAFRAAPEPHIVYADRRSMTFDDGAPDARLLCPSALAGAYRTALQRAERIGGLSYGDPMGAFDLRRMIAEMLSTHRGVVAAPDNICVTRGSQMAIFLAGRLLLAPGDAALVEGLSYAPARDAFAAAGAEVVGVPLDGDGIIVEAVEEMCRRRPVRAVYVTPHHQFPTTVSLTAERRARLLDLSGRFGFALIEDDYDHEFHYESQPLLPLASYAPQRVIYVGSTSKLLAPGLRVGYVAAPAAVARSIANEASVVDRQGNGLTELAVAELIESGELRRHARKALQVYRERRAVFADLLRGAFGERIDFTVPKGGLAFWVRFRDAALLEAIERNAPARGVRFLPSKAFAAAPCAERGLRLGFGALTPQEAKEAIGRLRAAADCGAARAPAYEPQC